MTALYAADKFPKTSDPAQVLGLRQWQDGAWELPRRDLAAAKPLQMKTEVFWTFWCWKNLPCTSKSARTCLCPTAAMGCMAATSPFLCSHLHQLLLFEPSSSTASLHVHFYSPSPVLKYYWGLGAEVSWYDLTSSCAPLRKPLIPGCGFQSSSPHCSVNSQQATETPHKGWKTSRTRKYQFYQFLLDGYWGDVSGHRRKTQINCKGLLTRVLTRVHLYFRGQSYSISCGISQMLLCLWITQGSSLNFGRFGVQLSSCIFWQASEFCWCSWSMNHTLRSNPLGIAFIGLVNYFKDRFFLH